jgi:flagellar biosynthesis protein FliQ
MPYEKIKELITIVKIVIQIFQIVTSDDGNTMEILIPMILVTILIMYIFLANYIGQNVTDHNNEVYIAA